MTEHDKQTIAKLEIIKELSDNKAVQLLTDAFVEYIKHSSKKNLGFKDENNN